MYLNRPRDEQEKLKSSLQRAMEPYGRPTDEVVAEIEEAIGVQFNNKDLLLQAFTHRSYPNDNPNWRLGHNETLEFLGDKVIDFLATIYLVTNYPNQREGVLTNWRSLLVGGRMLANVGHRLKLGQWLLLSRGEERQGGRENSYIIENVFEALVGAIFLDQGYYEAEAFLEEHLLVLTDEIINDDVHLSSKSILQEMLQGENKVTPTYEIINESGPAHDRTFLVGVFKGNLLLATGRAKSLKRAGDAAAAEAVKKIRSAATGC